MLRDLIRYIMKRIFVSATALILLVGGNASSPAPAQNSIAHHEQTIAQSATIRIAKIEPVSTLRAEPEQPPRRKYARPQDHISGVVPLSLLYLIAADGRSR